jgi:hypothetical protein
MPSWVLETISVSGYRFAARHRNGLSVWSVPPGMAGNYEQPGLGSCYPITSDETVLASLPADTTLGSSRVRDASTSDGV